MAQVITRSQSQLMHDSRIALTNPTAATFPLPEETQEVIKAFRTNAQSFQNQQRALAESVKCDAGHLTNFINAQRAATTVLIEAVSLPHYKAPEEEKAQK